MVREAEEEGGRGGIIIINYMFVLVLYAGISDITHFENGPKEIVRYHT